MLTDFETIFQICLNAGTKLLPVALSFTDDLFFLILAKLGIGIPGLGWIGPLCFVATIIFYGIRWIRQNSINQCD